MHILIMTLIFSGGVNTHEFNNELACEKAGVAWLKEISKRSGHGVSKGGASYICVSYK